MLAREGRGRSPVSLILNFDDGREAEFELPDRFQLSAEVRQAIKAIPGVEVQDL